MTDEAYIFRQDVLEKSRIARGVHNKNRTGKGAMKTQKDFMTEKELAKMNGEVKTWQLNRPMSWSEFKKMPEDIQKEYLCGLDEKFAPTSDDLAKMFGISKSCVQNWRWRHRAPNGRKGYARSASGNPAWAAFLNQKEPELTVSKPPIEKDPDAEAVQKAVAEQMKDFVDAVNTKPEVPAEACTDRRSIVSCSRVYAEQGSFTITARPEELCALLVRLCGPEKRQFKIEF